MSNLGRIVHLWVFSTVFFLAANHLNAQEFKTVSKVTDDSVWIKWLPTDYSALLNLKEGAIIRRIEVSSSQNLEGHNYASGKQWTISPLQERFDALNRSDSVQDRMATLLEPILSPVAEDAQNFAFGSALIENVTQPLFQKELGNFLVDASIEKRKKYAYKIEIKETTPLYVFIDPSEKTVFTKPSIGLTLDQKKTVVCSWDLTPLLSQSFAFDVEHAVNNTQSAERLFKEPYLPFKSEFEENKNEAEVRHEGPEKGKMHYYRVIGRDAFGAPSLASEWKGIYVPNRIDAYPVIDSVTVDGFSRLVHAHIESEDISGIEIVQLTYSENKDSGYEIVRNIPLEGSTKHRQFIFTADTKYASGDAFYYKVALLNSDDTVSTQPFYHFTLDQDAPIRPQNLNVNIDENGVAEVTWEPLNDPGLLGYRIFRGNSKREEFVERTNRLSLETKWIDTLALDNLTSEVYFFVQGVDANYNQGAHSDTVMGLKPDTIPPVAGLIRKISMVESGISLEMIPSSSADAVSNVLFRGTSALGEVEAEYLDSTAVPGKFYSYYIQTTDRSGNVSVSKKVSQKYEPGFRPAPTGSATADFQNNFVEIAYELPKLDIYAVQIYRCKKGEPSRRWKTIHDLEQTTIQDRSIRIGETYQYQVKYITKEGIHSLPLELEVSF